MSDFVRSSPLFDARRFAFALSLALFVTFVDMVFVHLAGIETLSELAIQTLVQTVGLYLAFSILALFGTELRL